MPSATPTRVVVADDSGLMRRVLSNALSNAGFDVVGQACDGDEALELCRRLRPDAMTLDLLMSGQSGVDVLRAIRSDEQLRKTPVVVVSILSTTEAVHEVCVGILHGRLRKACNRAVLLWDGDHLLAPRTL